MRNDRLLHAIRAAGQHPGPQFAAAAGIDYSRALLPYLRGTRAPVHPDGSLRTCAWSLCDCLGVTPAELWADEQRMPPALHATPVRPRIEPMLGLDQALHPDHANPEDIAARKQLANRIDDVLGTLTRREAAIVRQRYGIGTTELALDEVALRQHLTRSRICQIEAKALRKLRHPSRGVALLAQAYEVLPPSCQEPARD